MSCSQFSRRPSVVDLQVAPTRTAAPGRQTWTLGTAYLACAGRGATPIEPRGGEYAEPSQCYSVSHGSIWPRRRRFKIY